VYAADLDGDIAILSLSPDPSKSVKKAAPGTGVIHEPLHDIHMDVPVYTMPTAANGVLYIAVFNRLFAIADDPKR